jgi:hypothetical protein
MNEQIRAEFEQWANGRAHLDSFEIDGEKRYAALTASIMWESWQAAHARYAGAPAQPKVSDERLAALLEIVQDALQDAYQNAGLVCCGKSRMDCCGSPVADWSDADQKIMDALAPIQRELSAMLSAQENSK